MKMWEQPEVEVLTIGETLFGASESGNYDNMWMDGNGTLHSTYACS